MEEACRAALARLPGMNVLALPGLLRLAGGAETLWNVLAKGGNRAAALVGAEKAAAWADACRDINPDLMYGELERKGIRVVIPA